MKTENQTNQKTENTGNRITVPKISTSRFRNMSLPELRKFVNNYYKDNYLGKCVQNEHKGIIIHFTGKGKRKTAFGEAMYSNKAASILILDKLIRYGKFNNWGKRKKDDSKDLLGYYNFKCFAVIDEKKECIRLAVQVYRNGNICFNPYYNLEVNKKREKAGVPTGR